MREKIVELLKEYRVPFSKFPMSADEMYRNEAGQILSRIKEEIEKVENLKEMYTKEHEKGFEQCRQEILNLLCPKENVVGSVGL